MSEILNQAHQLLLAGDYSSAEALCRKALRKPNLAVEARKLLSEVLYSQGVIQLRYGGLANDAEKSFRAALEYNSKHVWASHNLGVLKDHSGALDEAIAFYRNALKHSPKNVASMQNLAASYQRAGYLEDAENVFEKLCTLDPPNAGLYLLRSAMQIQSIIPDESYPDQVRSRMSELLDKCLQAEPVSISPETYAAPYFYLSYHGKSNRELHEKLAKTYLHLCPSLAWEAPSVRMPRKAGSRVKVGIVSANMYDHSIGHTTRGLVEKLDRELFEVVVIHLGDRQKDDIVKAIDSAADSVHRLTSAGLHHAKEYIGALGLDILFYQDIGMEPFSYFLAFSRLAPIQVTSFGHPDTTGIPNMDYFISSDLYETEGAQDHYSEKLVLVPNAGTLSYYHKPKTPALPVPRSEFGLSEGDHLYLCPQTLFKVHPDMDAAILGIVQRDPRARIIFIEPSQRHMREALEARFKRLPASAFERIQFIHRMPHTQYLRLLSCADIMLDTVHFNGQNTNLEAFAMGIPVITWPGVMQRERHTIGMYKAMGLSSFSDLVASNAIEYADKAVQVVTNTKLRAELQSKIEQVRDVLYLNIGFIRSIEQLFLQLVRENSRSDSC